MEKVRTQLKDKEITHEEACRAVSCDYGIDQLESICNSFLLDFDELSKTYRAIENIFFKLNPSIKTKIKCGLAINLKYNLGAGKAALLTNMA